MGEGAETHTAFKVRALTTAIITTIIIYKRISTVNDIFLRATRAARVGHNIIYSCEEPPEEEEEEEDRRHGPRPNNTRNI